MQFLLVQNKKQKQDWILIGSGANGFGILWVREISSFYILKRERTSSICLIISKEKKELKIFNFRKENQLRRNMSQ